MQFHLFLSNTYQNAFLQVLQKLKKESQNDKNKTHFFVVPDRITLNAEKRIFEELNIQSSFHIEVITLSKLANKVLKQKINHQKVLSKQSGIMLTTKVILNNKQKLKAFQRATHFSGFIESVYETIMQLKSCNITPEEFLKSQENNNVSLQLKVEDLALIYNAYENELESGYLDASSKLNLLGDEIASSDIIKNAHFYFALFDSFTLQQYYIISKLTQYAQSVNIGICSNTKQNNASIYPTDMYNELTLIAKQYGMNLKDIIVNEKETFSPPFQHLLEHYGAYQKPIYLLNKTENPVQLFEGKDVREEVEFVASSILKKVHQNERYFNINVAVSNMSTYAPIIEEVFTQYKIPYYLDKSTTLLEHHFVQFFMQALKTAKNNFLSTDLLSYVKNIFSQIGFEEQNLLEDAILKYGIQFKEFLKEFTFKDKNIEQLELLRKKLVGELQFFNSKTDTVSNYVKNLLAFFEHKNVLEQLDMLEKQQEQNNNLIEKKRTSQVYEKVQKLLNELNELLKEEVVSLHEFYELLLQGLKSTTLSTIPVSVDCVFVGEVANNNFITSNSLFVLGANDGMLPNLKMDVGIILEDELKELNKKVPLEPSIYKLNQKTKFNLFQLLLTAKQELIVSYSRQDEQLKELKPSSIIQELQRLFYVKGQNKNEPLFVNTMEKLLLEQGNNDITPYYFANFNVALTKWLNAVQKARKEGLAPNKVLNELYEVLTKKFGITQIANYLSRFEKEEEFEKIKNAEELFFSASSTKVSQLESYFMCPFKHFLDYGLKLKEKERAGIKPIDVGIILHKVAEEFGQILKQKKNIESFPELNNKILSKILNKPQYAHLKERSEYKSLLLSLREESLRLIEAIFREQQHSDFKLNELEFSFGLNEASPLSFEIKNKTISFAGVVDRVDTYENYFRIIDYKTGKSDFSFKELYFGKKIQLFLYASVYRMLSGKNLAGVFYFPIKNEFEEEGSTKQTLYKMEGAFLGNLAVIKAFDKTLSAANLKSSFVYLTVKVDKQDNLIGLDHHSEKRSFTEEQFNKIEQYLYKMIEQALFEIMEGNIAPSPLKENSSICDYCQYQSSCPMAVYFKNLERPIYKTNLNTIMEAK